MKKTLSIVLIMLLLLTLMPLSIADDIEPQASPEPQASENQQTQDEIIPEEKPSPQPANTEPTPEPKTEETPVTELTSDITTSAEFNYTINKKDVTKSTDVEITEIVEDKVIDAKITETTETESETTTAAQGETIVSKEECIVQKGASDKGGDIITPLENDKTVTGGKQDCPHTNLSSKTVIQEAKCDQNGIVQQTCQDCGAVITELTERAAHVHIDGDLGINVTCAEHPYNKFVCKNCGLTVKQPITCERTKHEFDQNGICKNCEHVDSAYGKVEDEDKKNAASYTFVGETLTVYKGEGDTGIIPDYTTETEVGNDIISVPATMETPWHSFAEQVKSLIVASGITRIGDWAFGSLPNLQYVRVDSDKIQIGDFAFADDPSLETVEYTSTKAEVTYDHENTVVQYSELKVDDVPVVKTEKGSTAFYGDGTVTIDYNCQNKEKAKQEMKEFVNVEEHYGCYHNNVVVIPGYVPTEKEFGLSDGLYCKDCKTWIKYQYKIYPNGKETTGTYKITEYKDWKEVPEGLENTKYNTLQKLQDMKTDFVDAVDQAMKKTYNRDLLKDHYRVYSITMTKCNTVKPPETHIINIPYPTNTWPSANDYVVVQIQKNGTFKQLDTFMTNKGIQVETKDLLPVAVGWK